MFKYIGASKYKNVDKSQKDIRRGRHQESKGCFLKDFERDTLLAPNQLYLERIPTHCVTFDHAFTVSYPNTRGVFWHDRSTL